MAEEERTTTTTMEKQWHEHLTIDLFAHILNRSIFHPYIAWLIPLCLRAVATRYEAPEFIAACVWASLVTLSALLGIINRRIAYGMPREVDWDEEIVVITGGASGLGKILAETYGMRGASVAVLDIQKPEKESEGLAGVQFYTCDVGDAEAVEKAKREIEKDVCSSPNQLPHDSSRHLSNDAQYLSSASQQSSSTTPAPSTASPSSPSHPLKSTATSPSTSSPTSTPSALSSQACSAPKQAAPSSRSPPCWENSARPMYPTTQPRKPD